jgi:CrcB protein
MTALLVCIGAAIGAPSRYLLDQYLQKFIKYPYGILIVNVLGSFVIGLTVVLPRGTVSYMPSGYITHTQALVAVGFAGAFTTWSTFMLDLYLAFELKQYKSAATNLLTSLILGLGAAWIGIQLTQ